MVGAAHTTGKVHEGNARSVVGKEGRRKFEKFLREVAEDEDEDVIDVESK